jgi:DNA-binding transcriptional ArsR family regulator
MVEVLDITSDSLREKGYQLVKEGSSLALYYDGGTNCCCVSTLHRHDISRSEKKFERTLTQAKIPREIIELAKAAIIKNHKEMASKAIKANSTMEEWQQAVKDKHTTLKEIADKEIPGLWLVLEFAISIKAILNIDNITMPFIGIVLGPPSSYKSVGVDLLKNARDTFYTDNFSPKSFVSHNSNMTEDELEEVDLLPKIKNKLFLVSELAPLFTTKDDELAHVLGIIMRVADGNGYFSDTGSRGHRGYDGPLMFTWLGAAVDIPYKVHKLLSALGPKLYFLRLPMSAESEADLLNSLKAEDFPLRVRKVKTALFDYLETLESCPNMQMEPDSGVPKIEWDSEDSINDDAQHIIIYLAELLAYLRGTVVTWGETEGTQGLEYAYGSSYLENPRRAITQLHNLAKGHAISQGRLHITVDDDLPLIVKVVLSGAASIERVKVLNMLLNGAKGQKYTASDISETIGTSTKTAKRTMAEFKALGLVDLEELGNQGEPLIQIKLKDEFEWFFEPTFKKLKGDYVPGSFKHFLINKKKQKQNENEEGVEVGEEAGVPKASPSTLSFFSPSPNNEVVNPS